MTPLPSPNYEDSRLFKLSAKPMGPKFLASPSWLLVMWTIINDEKLSLTKEEFYATSNSTRCPQVDGYSLQVIGL